MGLSVSAAFAILLVGSLAMGAILYNDLSMTVDQIKEAKAEHETRFEEWRKCGIEIKEVKRPFGTITIHVLNTGSTVLDPEKVDVLIDGHLIPPDIIERRVVARRIGGYNVEQFNTHVWCPGEELVLRIPSQRPLTKHQVAVVTENGVSAYA